MSSIKTLILLTFYAIDQEEARIENYP